MKKILFSLFLMTVLMPVNAAERSQSVMLQAAHDVLLPALSRGDNMPDLKVLYINEKLQVIGAEGCGFAVIASDDRYDAVIGYSETDYVSTPGSGLDWFISAATESMKSGVDHAPVAASSDYATSVSPLLKTAWNQSKPYNNLCPTASRGSAYPTGCVATACSQIMNYHKYPVQGQGEKQYSFKPAEGEGRILKANFGETIYEWDKMLDDYEIMAYTDEQAKAVATLMLHCGVAVEMNYTPSGSGAYTAEARNGLIDFFRYNENIGYFIRDYYSQKEWMYMVYSELSKRRPIFYAGVDANGGGGHAFVIDGYNSAGLVHVNWGWGHNGGNGYYLISLLNSHNGTFSQGQEMLLGITTPSEPVEYTTHVVSDHPMSASVVATFLNVGLGTSLWNMFGYVWSGELGVILEGEQTYVLQSKAVTKVPNRKNVLNYIDGTIGGMLKVHSDIANGNYRLYIGVKDEKTSDWQLVRRRSDDINSYTLTINAGKISNLQAVSDDTWQRTTTAIRTIENDVYSKSDKIYTLSGREVKSPQKGIYLRGGRKVVVK